ncbi:MAG: hypothetical protein OIF32_11905 [Campylobacterales bacterium]|nr:hypothetical protein [Campylobacterales bacterium]
MRILLGFVFTVGLLFGNQGLESLYSNVVLKNSKEAVESAKNLETAIKKNRNVKKAFKDLIIKWKSVESFYILGELNEDYLDTPRYIDIFHQGNEDIEKQLDLIIELKDPIEDLLYKNSHKSVNALEFIIYKRDLKNKRVKKIAMIMAGAVKGNLQEIYDNYKLNKKSFLKDEKASNAIILNSLIENSYKLKEWRVGDAAGLSRKYKGKPDNRHGEYYTSKNSTMAIEAIINTHLTILDKQKFKNFGDISRSYGVNNEIDTAIKHLKESLEKVKKINNDDFTNGQDLYRSLTNLHNTYYISLIGALKVTSKILDADGD